MNEIFTGDKGSFMTVPCAEAEWPNLHCFTPTDAARAWRNGVYVFFLRNTSNI
jgi:hypothetical protein